LRVLWCIREETIKRLAILALIFAGCASTSPLADELARLDARILVDLDAAQAIAIANNDPLAAACFPALKEWLTDRVNTRTPTTTQVKGVISAYETARTVRRGIEGGEGIPVKLKLACAALLQDERMFALRLALLIGGGAVPGVGSIGQFLPQ
jgi:hypothetical protein